MHGLSAPQYDWGVVLAAAFGSATGSPPSAVMRVGSGQSYARRRRLVGGSTPGKLRRLPITWARGPVRFLSQEGRAAGTGAGTRAGTGTGSRRDRPRRPVDAERRRHARAGDARRPRIDGDPA